MKGIVDRLRRRALISITMDAKHATDWDEGRLSVFDSADDAQPEDLKAWAMRGLNLQRETTAAAEYASIPENVDWSEGREAGYRDIIDELSLGAKV